MRKRKYPKRQGRPPERNLKDFYLRYKYVLPVKPGTRLLVGDRIYRVGEHGEYLREITWMRKQGLVR